MPSGPSRVTVGAAGRARDGDGERAELARVDDRVARRQHRGLRDLLRRRGSRRRGEVSRPGRSSVRIATAITIPEDHRASTSIERRRRANMPSRSARFSQPSPRSGTKSTVFASSARPYDVDHT